MKRVAPAQGAWGRVQEVKRLIVGVVSCVFRQITLVLILFFFFPD